ncbi:MAG: 1-(5-phosphoribosyl)-5-[(5-phosphoribosylamino)methylideneamino] imidazole-4-carboxamide isomerase [Gemmatimonadales bacterium]
MDLFPAIDIRFGRVVRLAQGEAGRETRYDDDPVALAERFGMQGARWLHLVDLDRAFGDGDNSGLIGRIVTRVGSHLRIQLGGGLRTIDRLREVQDLEVTRFILGSAVVTNPELVPQALGLLGQPRVAVGLDARNGLVALRGWQETSTVMARDVAIRVAGEGVRTIVYTDIARDGMLAGPDFVGAVELQSASGAGVILSGGVGSLDDLLRARATAVAGVIVGRALYEGRFTLPEALTALLDI